MINLFWLFWIFVILFAIIGALRGWSKEVIAMSGLILSLFSLNTFGGLIIGFLGGTNDLTPEALAQQFIVLSAVHLVITFFSYQGVILVRNRLSNREQIQERLLGFLVGGVNGYFLWGTLWSFLEYQVTSDGFLRLPQGIDYAFHPQIARPVIASAFEELIITHLPLPWLGPILPVLLVIIFLFVIIAVI